MLRRAVHLVAVVGALALAASTARGVEPAPDPASRDLGRPTVRLDRLDFPKDVEGAAYFSRHLRQVLRREARRADWGAGRDNTIEYRFAVDRLDIIAKDGVLRVACTATGRLPGGETARSQLRFSGDPEARRHLVSRVLEIVARGVITRLAELERQRRGLT
jgi:hypothetical protein